MSNREVGTFYWGNTNSQTFLYGTDLIREAMDHVHFVNYRMPAGTTIHEWYSYTDYQLNRDIPMLPFLYVNGTYRIEPDIKSIPEDTYMLEVLLYDRFEQLEEKRILYPPDYSFYYDCDSYFYYTIRLINAGCDELVFHSFKLIEVSEDAE
jgi:accessory secretory protein Asp3